MQAVDVVQDSVFVCVKGNEGQFVCEQVWVLLPFVQADQIVQVQSGVQTVPQL
ncbi:MAG: hypothetical protein UR22_C0008G0001 [Parcubacteria group bacterium GW2011_GWC2_32_10]|nr:MAG: hypothetical protein UR22_C0008G0001 [Parcubacteria group bacterium GW2011_GWC2_32_10]